MRIILILFILALLPSPALSQIYKWKDDNGKVHITDDFYKVPEGKMDSVEKIRESARSRSSVKAPASTNPADKSKKAEVVLPTGMQPDEVYRAYDNALQTGKSKEAMRHMSRSFKESLTKRDINDIIIGFKTMDRDMMTYIDFRKPDIKGGRASLVVTSEHDGQDYMGFIKFVIEERSWKISSERWSEDD